MSNPIVAKRYAGAIFQLASEKKMLDQISNELQVLKEVLSTKDVYAAFTSPKVSVAKKKEIVEKCFSGFSTEVRNTLNVIIERHREDTISEIVDNYQLLVNEKNGISDAVVTSAHPITDSEKDEISKTFSKVIKKKSLNIKNEINPSILGGIKVQIGNQVFDGTLSGKLARLQRHLLG